MEAYFKTKKSKDDKFYFVIIAKNGEPLATSEMYESRAGMLKGINAIKSMLLNGKLADLSLYIDTADANYFQYLRF